MSDLTESIETQKLELEKRRLAFDEEKVQTEHEIALRELALKEKKLQLRYTEVELKKDTPSNAWHSPLVLAVIGATLAGIANLILASLNNSASLKVSQLEADAKNITTVIGREDVVSNIENIAFLVESNLIQSKQMKQGLFDYLEKRADLDLKSLNYSNDMRVQVLNRMGPPVEILSSTYSRNNRDEKSSLYEYFDLGVDWDTYTNLPKGRVIRSGEIVDLVKLTESNLKSQGVPGTESDEVYQKWVAQKKGIAIRIKYRATIGGETKTLLVTLK